MLRRVLAVLLISGLAATGASTSSASTPNWKSVSTGDAHTCAIRGAGTLYCWGSGPAFGSKKQVNRPTRISAMTDWKSVDAGLYNTCAIRGTGKLYCWGNLGDSENSQSVTKPKQVTAKTDWKSVSSGGSDPLSGNPICAIRGSGKLYCWGGAVGRGHRSPTQITAMTDWISVSTGGDHACAIRRTGALYCWGANYDGQLGDNTNDEHGQPEQPTSMTDWKMVSAGGSNNCAIRGSGLLYCWGGLFPAKAAAVRPAGRTDGRVLPLGDGEPIEPPQPSVPVRIGTASNWTKVSAGSAHLCALRGSLYCWGNNFDGQVGDRTRTDVPTPKRIGTLTSWNRVDAGGSFSDFEAHTCGIRKGWLYCWGSDRDGQLGNGKGTTNHWIPSKV